MKTCTICTATKSRRHARHVATYKPKVRAVAPPSKCKVCGAACGGRALTCSDKCRKAASRKRQRINAEVARLKVAMLRPRA